MTICEEQYKSLCNWKEFIQVHRVLNTPTNKVVSSQELEFKSKYAELFYSEDVSTAVEPSSQITA